MDQKSILLTNQSSFLPGFREEVWTKLWPHQKKAINNISEYVIKLKDKEKKTSKLIALPTGSGKSGIIASVARFMKFEGPILIVVPRRELRTQLAADMSGSCRYPSADRGRFFEHAGVLLSESTEGAYPRVVRTIDESEQLSSDKAVKILNWRTKTPYGSQYVLVTTIQLLTHIWRNSENLKSKHHDRGISEAEQSDLDDIVKYIQNNAGLVVFDEGHYEPAPSWSEVIRSINAPRIIFTATPFRNDLRRFDWGNKDAFFISFKEMVKEYKKIRDIRIERITLSLTDMEKTINKIENRRKKLQAEFNEDVEVIIRVGSRARVLEVASVLNRNKLSYLAIHDRPTKEKYKGVEIIKDYPLTPKGKVTYWIHQYKLLEGIDRPQISLLVILDRLKNMRALVQQIGRLTRRQSNGRDRPYALVLDPRGEVEIQWSLFTALEDSLKKNGFGNRTAAALVDAMLRGLNATAKDSPIFANGSLKYVLTPKREIVDKENDIEEIEDELPWDNESHLDYAEDLIINTNAQVLRFVNQPRNDWPRVIDEVFNECKETYYPIWRVTPLDTNNAEIRKLDGRTLVILGISATASPFFKSHVLYDLKVQLTLLYRTDPYVFVYDSLGRNFKSIKNLSQYLDYGSPGSILQQLKQFDGQEIRSISLKSSRYGRALVLSQTKNAIDLTSVPASLNDPTQIVSAARGFAEYEEHDVRLRDIESRAIADSIEPPNAYSRRVGVSTRRITDYGDMVTIKDFCGWAESIAENIRSIDNHRLTGNKVVGNYFGRFSPEAPAPPEGWEPKWLYLDLARFEMEYMKTLGKEQFPILDEGLVEIKKVQNKFIGKIKVKNSVSPDLNIEIKFNKSTGKYKLESEDLDSYRPVASKEGSTILQVLNQEATYSILPSDTKYFYTMGAFYLPGIRFGSNYDDAQTGLLSTIVQIDALQHIRSEKGDKEDFEAESTGWPERSLFGIVDAAARKSVNELSSRSSIEVAKRLQAELGNVSWLICDDMGTERADFVVFSERLGQKYVILIHAKVKPIGKKADHPPSYLSATGLSDVCMQAQKNLDFLGPRIADHTRNWHENWTLKKSNGVGLNRIRVYPEELFGKTSKDLEILRTDKSKRLKLKNEAEKEFGLAINNPSVQREVWLLTGGLFSRKAFDELLHTESPSSKDIPIVYTLFGTSTIVASSPARLRVFAF